MRLNENPNHQEHQQQYRWQKILQLPGEIWLKHLASGQRYQVRELEPVYTKNHCVFYFKRIGSDAGNASNFIDVSMLRLLQDGPRCSIGGLGR